MSTNDTWHYTKIRENIWQIEEDNSVCCTLVKGSELALLIDTGFGHRNLRAFVESHVDTPYMVANSHGHPDHIGGNHWFDTVWIPAKEAEIILHFEETPSACEKKLLQDGHRFSLGNLHVKVIPLPGHTKGSIGFLVEEEKLLIAGDALNEELWLFNYGSLSMKQLEQTLERTILLDFDSYLCGHSREEYPKEKISAHIKNIETLNLDACTRQTTLGFDTYCCSYRDSSGISRIVFTSDRLRAPD